MSKRYTEEEDQYIHGWVEDLGDGFEGRLAWDIQRSEASVKARIAKLKKTGGWEALGEMNKAYQRYLCAVGRVIDVDDEALP